MILFKKGSVENVFHRKKLTMKFYDGRLWRRKLFLFSVRFYFYEFPIFFHPPLKLFYLTQVNKFPFQYFIQLADRRGR